MRLIFSRSDSGSPADNIRRLHRAADRCPHAGLDDLHVHPP